MYSRILILSSTSRPDLDWRSEAKVSLFEVLDALCTVESWILSSMSRPDLDWRSETKIPLFKVLEILCTVADVRYCLQ